MSLMPVHQQFRRRTFLIVRGCSMTGTHLRSPTSAGGLEEPIDTLQTPSVPGIRVPLTPGQENAQHQNLSPTGLLVNSVDGGVAGFVDNDAACLHHPTHFADGHLDVGKGIAFDGNDVGDIAGRDRTQGLLHPEHLRR